MNKYYKISEGELKKLKRLHTKTLEIKKKKIWKASSF